MTKIKEVIEYLEALAPTAYQENYDNARLITGNIDIEVSGVLITLDCIEAVVDEAIDKDCNFIIAHHPIVFVGLKSLTGKNYVERTVIKALKNDIAIYSVHTNLDNIHTGVNKKIADKIGLQNTTVLSPKTNTLQKLVTFVPKNDKQKVLEALYQAGAGDIGNYSNCSFSVTGTGTFKPNDAANPHIGSKNKPESVEEVRIELIYPAHLNHKVLSALNKNHPYEEVAYYVSALKNTNQEVGSGMIGELTTPMEPLGFFEHLKYRMNVSVIRHTSTTGFNTIKKVAVCGGAGSFLLDKAKALHADVFVSADFKYHEFFDADGDILIADIGHYESEAFTKELIHGYLSKKFTNFALNLSEITTNPIRYF